MTTPPDLARIATIRRESAKRIKRLLTSEEEYELALALRDPATRHEATEVLVECNQGLVWREVTRFRVACTAAIDVEDLEQYGFEGLLHAIAKWDPDRSKLSTYAPPWIAQRIRRGLDNDRSEIRLPVHIQETLRRLQGIRSDLAVKLGRTPTNAELAQAMGIDEAKLDRLNAAAGSKPISLDADLAQQDDRTLHDLVTAPDDCTGVLDAVGTQHDRSELARAVASLPARHQEIIRLCYGFDGEPIHKQAEIARRAGVSRERIRQIRVEALDALREQLVRDVFSIAAD